MDRFKEMFSQAVSLILEENRKRLVEKDETSKKEERVTGASMILWEPGGGRWSEVIKGLKEDASYREAVSKSSASGAKSMSLMARLGVSKKSRADDSLESAGEILSQAVKSPIMSKLYGEPTVTKDSISIPVELSMDEKDIRSGEGMSGRNVTVFIHLTLIGAYNSGMFEPSDKLRILKATPESGAVVIRKE